MVDQGWCGNERKAVSSGKNGNTSFCFNIIDSSSFRISC